MRESNITFGQIFFVTVAGWWLYGIYTAFFQGRIPLLNWQTEHNLILGFLWVVVFGVGAPVPAKTFMNYSGFIALTGHGRLHWPLFFGNVLIQLYLWVLLVTVWFAQPQPWPFEALRGGILRGLLMLPVICLVALACNLICLRSLKRLAGRVRRDTSLIPGGSSSTVAQ